MTIKELKELIKDMPDDCKVLLSVPADFESMFEGFRPYNIAGLSDSPNKDEVLLCADYSQTTDNAQRLSDSQAPVCAKHDPKMESTYGYPVEYVCKKCGSIIKDIK